jgi:hypothetical protein
MAQARDSQKISLSAATSTGCGTQVTTSGYRHLFVSIYCVGGTATVKLRGALLTGVTLASAVSASNQWDFVEMVDLEDGASIAGDTGLSMTDGDCRLLAINVDGLYSVALDITARSGSTVTGYIISCDND